MYKKIKLSKSFELSSDYFSISIANNEIELINFYNSNTFIYFLILDNEIVISDDFSKFDLKISKVNVNKFINNVSIGALPVFNEDVITLPHGYKLKYDIHKSKYKINRYKSLNSIILDPVLCLENVLVKYVKSANIAISFSGGLDSTSILYACKKKFPDKNIVAFNWWNKGCSNNDYYESEKICKNLNIQLIKIEITPDDLISEIDLNEVVISNYPLPYLIFINYIKKFINVIKEYYKTDDFIIINGTGGDHIFMESIPLEYICNLKFNDILKIADIYSISYPLILKKYIKLKLAKYKFNDKNYIEQTIYESLCQTSTSYLKNSNFFFFPFSTEEMIECSLKYEIKDTFNKFYFRNHFRESLKNHYFSNDFFRINKGSMTGAYQKKLFLNKNKIEQTLNNGFLVNNQIINHNETLKLLHYSSIGVGGVHPKLIIPIIFEYVLNAYKRM